MTTKQNLNLHTALDRLVDRNEQKLEQLTETLRCNAASLADRMTKLAKQLDEKGAHALVNELGEVQSRGAEVDRQCAELGAAKRFLAELRHAQSKQND